MFYFYNTFLFRALVSAVFQPLCPAWLYFTEANKRFDLTCWSVYLLKLHASLGVPAAAAAAAAAAVVVDRSKADCCSAHCG